jgi:hypothetical protein
MGVDVIKIASKRIKDRNISWKENYTERTEPLKVRYEDAIGTGSYYRWEGHDYTTNSDYYVVCSPAKTEELRESFFAGIKKLPPIYKRDVTKVYSPYGKYFNNIASALTFLSDKYGISYPKNQTNYTDEDLRGVKIPRFIKA